MIKLSSRVKFGFGLLLFCCGYWLLDSLWAYVSFEKNLSYLVFRERYGWPAVLGTLTALTGVALLFMV